jgi:putative transposase
LIPKGERRFKVIDDTILSLYSRGLSTRDIQEHVSEIYGGIDISPMMISRVTDNIKDDIQEWRQRPLEKIYPILYLDAMVLKIRDGGLVQNKSLYLAMGITLQGEREVLGMWLQNTEGAKFWLQILTELQQRGIEDIFIACVDGLKGFPQAISSVFPNTVVQVCIVHLIRHSLRLVAWKNRRKVAKDLRAVYTAVNEESGRIALETFRKQWEKQYPLIYRTWKNNWEDISSFYHFTSDIRRVIYTTNMIESLNSQLRKKIKQKGSFPTEESALKMCDLAIHLISKKWTGRLKGWDLALQQLAIHFEGRLTMKDLNNIRLAN